MVPMHTAPTGSDPVTADDRRGLLRRALGRDAWRRALRALGLLPVSLASIVAAPCGRLRWAAGVHARLTGRRAAPPSGRTLAASVLGVPLGLAAWVVGLLVGPNTVRNVLLYGLTDGDGTEHAWGGPSLAGAWAVHAVLAFAFLPIGVALLGAIARLHARLLDDDRPRWVPLVASAVAAYGVLFAIALVRQL
jgi:hypothetical protein